MLFGEHTHTHVIAYDHTAGIMVWYYDLHSSDSFVTNQVLYNIIDMICDKFKMKV